jgi:hypothetical protein
MKAKDLIAALSNLPPDAIVGRVELGADFPEDGAWFHPIEGVRQYHGSGDGYKRLSNRYEIVQSKTGVR